MPISREEKNLRRREKRARNKHIIGKADRLRELLKEFDARLFAFDPGVAFVVHGDVSWNSTITMDGTQWAWLEPILEELRDRRHNMRAGLTD